TPMNAIIGLTKLALKTEPAPKMMDYLTKIDNASHSMLGIINDILEFSKIEAGHLQLNLAPFNLQELFDRLGDLFRSLAVEKGLELILAVPSDEMLLMGDAMRLEQVLTNLISNAIKFTESGEILIETKVVKKEAQQVEIEFSVHDSGIGIDPIRLPYLFESFVQADSSITRKYGGTGLGLAISKRIVGVMGGKIWAASEPKHGSIFRFTAVFSILSNEQKPLRQLPKVIELLKVLLVDTKKNSRKILEEALQTFALETTSVASVTEAAFLLFSKQKTRSPYQLVILNFRDSEQEGVKNYKDMITTLSTQSGTVHLPKAILLTNIAREEKCMQMVESGIHACVEKPVSRSQLFNTILGVFGFEAFRNHTVINQEKIQESQIKKQFGGARILVVEDNAINMQVIRELLERVGLIVEEANHGKTAWKMLQSREYAVVLMDLQMPEMDGFTATRLIRGDQRFKTLPIIAMTAHAMEEDRKKCLAAGMNGHVGKPFNPQELYDILTRWIDMSPPTGVADKPMYSVHALPSELPGFNIREGIARMGEDAGLYRRMLLRFHQEHALEAEKVAAALREGDRPLAERLAHTMKSTAGQLGAIRFHQAASRLEQGIACQDPNEPALLAEFTAALDEIMHALRQLPLDSVSPALSIKSAKEVREVDLQQISPLLRQLAFMLTEQESNADTLLQPLRAGLLGHPACSSLDEVARYLQRYDYIQAFSVVVELAKELGIAVD
ncbi:MAG: response regulator, partial [Magnetococcus sp. YQC-5]